MNLIINIYNINKYYLLNTINDIYIYVFIILLCSLAAWSTYSISSSPSSP